MHHSTAYSIEDATAFCIRVDRFDFLFCCISVFFSEQERRFSNSRDFVENLVGKNGADFEYAFSFVKKKPCTGFGAYFCMDLFIFVWIFSFLYLKI